MNKHIASIIKSLEQYRETADSYAHDLRLAFTELVIHQMRERNWTQQRLAEECGKSPAFISRVLSGDDNWTTDTAGAILYALRVRPRLAAGIPATTAHKIIDGRNRFRRG